MRDIKFRAWDKNKERMTTEFSIYSDGKVDRCIAGYTDPPIDYILMQYTGLKDKNGVDVFEGDIVTYTVPFYQTRPKNGDVVFSKGSYKLKYEDNLFYIDGYMVVEVIGNIYENPDLVSK